MKIGDVKDIDLRYARLIQKMSKFDEDISNARTAVAKETNIKIYNSSDEPTIVPVDGMVDDLESTLRELKTELFDLIVDEEVEDFLQNGPGITVDNGH